MPVPASYLPDHPAERIGALAHTEPELLISAGDGNLYGAVWSHLPVVAEVVDLQYHAVALHLSGCTLVEKWRDGRLAGHRSRVGSVTLVPANVASTWVLSGYSRVAHLYVHPSRVAEAAAHADGPVCGPEIREFFAEPDEAMAALVRVVLAQAQAGIIDTLAHDEVMTLLVRRLLARYAAGRPLPAAALRVTLTTATLRRLYNHIEANLSGDLRLSELAELARLSQDHFLRAFKSAVGQTPHQYVLGRRISHTQRLLALGKLPVAEIARAGGFRGPSHFSAVFRQKVGLSPTDWRKQRRS